MVSIDIGYEFLGCSQVIIQDVTNSIKTDAFMIAMGTSLQQQRQIRKIFHQRSFFLYLFYLLPVSVIRL
uniref:Uncharacterized protein n=1 Tax=Octopus bimaculoides TaxID=37653 RepID=A0A0L8GIE3_OCTBM